MLLGPIVASELRTSARRASSYSKRAGLPGLALLVIAANVVWWYVFSVGAMSIRDMSRFGEMTFATLMGFQLVTTIFLVPEAAAKAIAEENERRRLGTLLSTRLSAAEVVLGKLAAALLQYAWWMASVIPIVLLLPLLGGVDPRIVVLAYAGLASTAFLLAGLSILLSTGARSVRAAIHNSIGLGTAWLVGPFFFAMIAPRLWPKLANWLWPLNTWLLASTPMCVVMNLFSVMRWGTLAGQIGWMIVLQVACGTLFVLLAIVRLRPAYRYLQGGDGGLFRRRGAPRRWRLWPRPRCGNDPVLWKELHTSNVGGLLQLMNLLVYVGLFAGLAWAVFYFAKPAFLEVLANGYGSRVNDIARIELNRGLRSLTAALVMIDLLVIAGAAAEGMATERARETWDSLIMTPLSGHEILRAKRIGAVSKWWGVSFGIVALWTVGLAVGAVHPLGFVAALLALAAATWFTAALGTYVALYIQDLGQATTWTLLPVLLLVFSAAAPFLLQSSTAMVFLGVGSIPFIEWLSLLSYPDVRAAIHAGAWQAWKPMGTTAISGVTYCIAAYLVAVIANWFGALYLNRCADNQFDAAVGRPLRTPDLERSRRDDERLAAETLLQRPTQGPKPTDLLEAVPSA